MRRAWFWYVIVILLIVVTCAPSIPALSHKHGKEQLCAACPVCEIANMIKSLMTLLFIALAASWSIWHKSIFIQHLLMRAWLTLSPTPITLKTRMND